MYVYVHMYILFPLKFLVFLSSYTFWKVNWCNKIKAYYICFRNNLNLLIDYLYCVLLCESNYHFCF